MNFRKPKRLMRYDTVAVLSPSRGAPSSFPSVYEFRLRNLEEEFGLSVQEYPTARANHRFLYENPKIRADDVNKAFADDEISAIVTTIGGDDSIRILPYLDSQIITGNSSDSVGEQIQRAFPDAKVMKTLNTVNYEIMTNPSLVPGEHDLFMSGNDKAAKAKAREILTNWFGWKSVIDLYRWYIYRAWNRDVPSPLASIVQSE